MMKTMEKKRLEELDITVEAEWRSDELIWFRIYGKGTYKVKDYLKKLGYWWFPEEGYWGKPVVKLEKETLELLKEFKSLKNQPEIIVRYYGAHVKTRMYVAQEKIERVFRKISREIQALEDVLDAKVWGHVKNLDEIIDWQGLEEAVKWFKIFS